MTQLYPSQIEMAKAWLAKRPGRFKSKRLRKKFFSRPIFYIKYRSHLEALNWFIPMELLKEAHERTKASFRPLLGKDESFTGRYYPVPIELV